MPSSEATKELKFFVQQQININEIIQSNTTVDFGLGHGFEIGVNVLGLNFSENNASIIENDSNDVDPYNPLLMLNALKQFEVSEDVSIVVGGQIGVNFTDNKATKTVGLGYTNVLFKDLLVHDSRLVIGSYYNSEHYGGTAGNRIGAWIGSEIPIAERFHVVAESVIGDNALSYTSLGAIYFVTPHIPLTLGVQIPNTKANSYSIVFEFTYVP